MLNEITDNAIIKVIHLCPRYALAREDIKNYERAGLCQVFKDFLRLESFLTGPTKVHQKSLCSDLLFKPMFCLEHTFCLFVSSSLLTFPQ